MEITPRAMALFLPRMVRVPVRLELCAVPAGIPTPEVDGVAPQTMEREVNNCCISINPIAAPPLKNIIVQASPTRFGLFFRDRLVEVRPLEETIMGLRLRAHDVIHAVANE